MSPPGEAADPCGATTPAGPTHRASFVLPQRVPGSFAAPPTPAPASTGCDDECRLHQSLPHLALLYSAYQLIGMSRAYADKKPGAALGRSRLARSRCFGEPPPQARQAAREGGPGEMPAGMVSSPTFAQRPRAGSMLNLRAG